MSNTKGKHTFYHQLSLETFGYTLVYVYMVKSWSYGYLSMTL